MKHSTRSCSVGSGTSLAEIGADEKIRRIRRDLESGRFQPRPNLVDEAGKIAQPTVDAPTKSPGKTLIKPRGTRKPVNVLARTAPDPIEAARRALTTDQMRRDIEGRDVADRVRNAARAWLGRVRRATRRRRRCTCSSAHGRRQDVDRPHDDRRREASRRRFRRAHRDHDAVAREPRGMRGEDAEERGLRRFRRGGRRGGQAGRGLGLMTLVYKGAVRGLQARRAQAAVGRGPDRVGQSLQERVEGHRRLTDRALLPALRHLPGYRAACVGEVLRRHHDAACVPEPADSAEITESAKGLVIDEAVWSQLARTTTLPLAVLKSTRPLPRLTRAERKAGIDPETLIQERDLAVDIVLQAFERGECPAAALHAHKQWGRLRRERARRREPHAGGGAVDLSGDAAGSRPVHRLGPEVEAGVGRSQVLADHQGSHREPAARRRPSSARERGRIEHPRKAKGARDQRIQLTKDGVRISWRVEPNLARFPLLLMDASAERRIVEKLGRVPSSRPRSPRSSTCGSSLPSISRGRTAASGPTPRARRRASGTRRAISRSPDARFSTIALAHGAGHVLVGSTMTTREALQTAWAEPDNVDFGHYGAFRGLDFANAHSAAFGIGRMELPIQVIDGLVAAFSYDDDEPELPMDLRGDGLLEDGSPLRPAMGERVVRHRDGSDWTLRIQEHRGPWAKVIQRQYREEELRQFLGRLRPVYRRGEAPIVYIATNAIPEDWIVDEIVALEDLALPDVGGLRWTEAVRRTGVIDAAAWGEDAPDAIGRIDGQVAIGRMGAAMDDLTVDVRATVGEHDHPLDVKVAATVEDIDGTVREHLRRRGLKPITSRWSATSRGSCRPAGRRPTRSTPSSAAAGSGGIARSSCGRGCSPSMARRTGHKGRSSSTAGRNASSVMSGRVLEHAGGEAVVRKAECQSRAPS